MREQARWVYHGTPADLADRVVAARVQLCLSNSPWWFQVSTPNVIAGTSTVCIEFWPEKGIELHPQLADMSYKRTPGGIQFYWLDDFDVSSRKEAIPPIGQIYVVKLTDERSQLSVVTRDDDWQILVDGWELMQKELVLGGDKTTKELTSDVNFRREDDINRMAMAEEERQIWEERKVKGLRVTHEEVIDEIRRDYGWPLSSGKSDRVKVDNAWKDVERIRLSNDIDTLEKVAARRAEVEEQRRKKKEKL